MPSLACCSLDARTIEKLSDFSVTHLLFNMHEVDEIEENSLSLRIRKVVKKVVRLLGESEL